MAQPRLRYDDYFPPKGHPLCRVFYPPPFELAYLSWGHRWYGDKPAPARAHDGWHYFVVLEGRAVLEVNGRRFRTQPGLVSVAHPDCEVGHADRPGRRCRMLTWVWRAPPVAPALQPPAGGHLRLQVEPVTLRRLVKLHEQCREAAAVTDERSQLHLRIARLQLELGLLEGRNRRRAADDGARFQLAVDYLRDHLGEAKLVRRLAGHLGLSEASLKRLFRRRTGQGPRAFVQAWRMRWAQQQLAGGGTSVKAVAFALGYRYANDFSRAFTRHHGAAATTLLRSRGGPGQRWQLRRGVT